MIRASHLVRAFSFLVAFASITSAQAVYDIGDHFSLDPPPAHGSPTDVADYRELHRLQETRTEEECDVAAAQTRMTADPLFGPRLGIVSDSEFQKLQPMLEEVLDTVAVASKPIKRQYARARPYETDPTIHPCVPLPGGGTSYPSSHAASGIVVGHVLKLIFPSRSEQIDAEADQIGENRLIGGVHHPSDVEAGRDLGEQIWTSLEANPEFKNDLRAMKASFR